MIKILVLLWVRGETLEDSEQRSERTAHVLKGAPRHCVGNRLKRVYVKEEAGTLEFRSLDNQFRLWQNKLPYNLEA